MLPPVSRRLGHHGRSGPEGRRSATEEGQGRRRPIAGGTKRQETWREKRRFSRVRGACYLQELQG